MPLDHLVEQRRAVLHGLGKDLQQITVLVAVDQDTQLLKPVPVLVDLPDAFAHVTIIAIGDPQKIDVATLQLAYGLIDVLRSHRDVLNTRAIVVIQILLDLAFLLAFRRLIYRKLAFPRAVLHHLAHQCAVFGADILVGEVHQVIESEHVLKPLRPIVHLSEVDVSDDVVDRFQAHGLQPVGFNLFEPRCEGAAVVLPVDEPEHAIPGVLDFRRDQRAVFILPGCGRQKHGRPSFLGLPNRVLDVVARQCNCFDAVAVKGAVAIDLAVGRVGAGEHETGGALCHYVARPLAVAGLQAALGDRLEAERLVVKVGRLLGVADVELNVVVALDGQEISGHVNPLPIFTGSSRTPRPG